MQEHRTAVRVDALLKPLHPIEAPRLAGIELRAGLLTDVLAQAKPSYLQVA